MTRLIPTPGFPASRRFAIALCAMGVIGCSERELPVSPTGPDLNPRSAPISASDCTGCLLGPLVLERTTGAPNVHTFALAANPADDHVLELRDLTGKGTTLEVRLNGTVIAIFTGGTAALARYPIDLGAASTLMLRQTGKPGSAVEVRLVGSAPPPPPLATVFEGPIVGIAPAEVEAACLQTPLPTANDSYYVIRQLERLIISRVLDEPWPGRARGDVHARQTTTEGKLRFSCTPHHRDGSSGSPLVVELGTEGEPVVTSDVKACEADGEGGSRATAINTGQLACPYPWGNIFPAHPDYFTAGPYATVEAVEGPTCTIFRPAVLGEGGRKHPILLWANGITLSPHFYRGLLTHFASHGFVVAAADTSRVGTAGNGQNVLACLAYLEAQHAGDGIYANRLNIYRVGVAGHSAGGAGVIMAGRDPRITATAPVQPWVGLAHGYDPAAAGQQNGPMFLSSGELDTEIPYSHPEGVYTAANVPIFWGHRLGSGHNDPLWDAPLYRRPLTAWFRAHLMLDVSAASLFYGPNCQLCLNANWVVQRKNGIN